VFFLLCFSSSCFVIFSLSEVCQFKFACCPRVLEISSVVHQLSCFGVGFLLCLLTGGLFLCLTSFLWGKVSDLSPQGIAGRILPDNWHSPVWSAECLHLPSRFGVCGWQWQQPSCFFSATWYAETFYGLGFHDAKVLILLSALFPPSVAPVSQQGFWFMELMQSSSVP
jgi:hypothetical protein